MRVESVAGDVASASSGSKKHAQQIHFGSSPVRRLARAVPGLYPRVSLPIQRLQPVMSGVQGMSKTPLVFYSERTMRSVQIESDQERVAEALAEAIRQPLRDLTAAAEEAQNGRLGGAKLGVLVAASGILKALQAIDAEFERQGTVETMSDVESRRP